MLNGKKYNVNDQIKAQIINLVFLDGKVEEAVKLSEALKIAENMSLDVVEVSAKGKNGFPVCKIIDYGKMIYQQNKKRKNKSQVQHNKEIRCGLNIDIHDLVVKHKKILKFLTKKYIVKYILELKGRERNMVPEAIEKMNDNLEEFKDLATWKSLQVSYGKRILIFTTLMPLRS